MSCNRKTRNTLVTVEEKSRRDSAHLRPLYLCEGSAWTAAGLWLPLLVEERHCRSQCVCVCVCVCVCQEHSVLQISHVHIVHEAVGPSDVCLSLIKEKTPD